jgi:hypothetical protein
MILQKAKTELIFNSTKENKKLEQNRRTLGLSSDPNTRKDEILPQPINTQFNLLLDGENQAGKNKSGTQTDSLERTAKRSTTRKLRSKKAYVGIDFPC